MNRYKVVFKARHPDHVIRGEDTKVVRAIWHLQDGVRDGAEEYVPVTFFYGYYLTHKRSRIGKLSMAKVCRFGLAESRKLGSVYRTFETGLEA